MSPTASNSSSLSMTAPARLVGQQQLQVVQYLVFSTPGTLMDPCEPDRSVRRACFRVLGDLWDVVLPKTNKSLSVFSFSLCTSTLILQFLQEIFLCKTVLPFFLRLPVCFMYKTCRQASVDQPQFVFFTFMIFIKENTSKQVALVFLPELSHVGSVFRCCCNDRWRPRGGSTAVHAASSPNKQPESTAQLRKHEETETIVRDDRVQH